MKNICAPDATPGMMSTANVLSMLSFVTTMNDLPGYRITDVHGAIAESGTIVCASDAGHSRGLSLVPPVHIALVRQSDILPDLIDFLRKWKGTPGSGMPSSLTLITGPSKTADIEGELIVGVHGPGQVHIVVMEGV